jgi:hypothetical protein
MMKKFDNLDTKHLKIKDTRSLIIFIICMGLLIGIPIYWFLLVPPALELQEINQSSYTASGYFAPGGYFSVKVNLGKESILGYHNGALNIIPNITNPQNESLWQPTEKRVDQWPGSKSEIKYSSSDPITRHMILIINLVEIPNSTELKGKTVPITIKYSVNYPVQTGLTEVLGGSITNFGVNTEYYERNITVNLNNQVITPRDIEIISMNETWKKILSLVIWIFALLFILLVYTKFDFINNFKTKSRNLLKKVKLQIRKILKIKI